MFWNDQKPGPKPKSTIWRKIRYFLKVVATFAYTALVFAFAVYSSFKLVKASMEIAIAIAMAGSASVPVLAGGATAFTDFVVVARSAFVLMYAIVHAWHDSHQAKRLLQRSFRVGRIGWKRFSRWIERLFKR